MNDYIRVAAPATLEENFTFDVLLDGKPFTVVVPEGGVVEGEEFEVPYPREFHRRHDDHYRSNNDNNEDEDYDEKSSDRRRDSYKSNDNNNSNSNINSSLQGRNRRSNVGTSQQLPLPPTMSNSADEEDQSTKENDRLGAPYGKFRVSLCSCCDVLTQTTFWMSFCCFPVLLAQVLTRLRLKWNGEEIYKENEYDDDDDCTYIDKQQQTLDREEESVMTFNKVVLTFVGVLALGHIPIVGSLIVFLYIVITMVWVGGNLRKQVRQRYKIPQTKCCSIFPNGVEDRCTMCFCGCCALVQLARHTHNDKDHPGVCCTTTGLELGAPPILPTFMMTLPVDTKENGGKQR